MTMNRVAAESISSLGAPDRRFESFPGRELNLGSLAISRALPVKDKRLVGPWCFLDRFGPLSFSEERPMDVAPHPHIGLQTVTWLLEGEVLHGDSLGSEAIGQPGGVNVMTAGAGIAHAEQTPAANSGRLNGVQLWVALPEAHRHVAPSFARIDQVPIADVGSAVVQVFAGNLAGASSPAPHYSPLVGADVNLPPRGAATIPLAADFEHAVLVMSGDCAIEGREVAPRMLHYLGTRRPDAHFTSRAGGRLLLIGGPPFGETVLMWWNFVARTPEEIEQARTDWEERRRFGDVGAYTGSRMHAPPLVRFARPNPIS
jgi:redox-sensitive bicupin YhaK (pirin superfamily)